MLFGGEGVTVRTAEGIDGEEKRTPNQNNIPKLTIAKTDNLIFPTFNLTK